MLNFNGKSIISSAFVKLNVELNIMISTEYLVNLFLLILYTPVSSIVILERS